jgi:hypothetical protein
MISILQLSTSHVYVAKSNYHLYMAYIYLSQLIQYAMACSAFDPFWVGVDYWQTSWCYRDLRSLVWCQRFISSMTVTMVYSIIINSHWAIRCLTFFHTNSYTVLVTLTLTADKSAFIIMELGYGGVWPVGRGCLLLLGTWSHLRYVLGSVLAHLFLWHVL